MGCYMCYLKRVEEFLVKKEPKKEGMLKGLLALPEISLTKDISLLTSLLIRVRQYLNLAVQLYRNVEMLQSSVKVFYSDLDYILTENKIKCLSDPEWVKVNLLPKMSKEEREMNARMYNKDLSDALHRLDMFSVSVDSLKRAIYNKKEDLERVRKDLTAMVWGVRTEELLNNRVAPEDRERVKEFLSTGIKGVDDYLNMNKRK